MSSACDRPLELRALLDYWLDDDVSDHEQVEEHLFACEACSRRLQELVALGAGIHRLVRDGVVEAVVTPALLARAVQEGLRIREYRLAPGESVNCTVTPEDDLLVSRLVGRFEGVSRLDVVEEREGLPARRIEDVPIRPDAGELIVAQAMPVVRALQRARLRVRLLSQEQGGERLVGEYTFEHYPTR